MVGKDNKEGKLTGCFTDWKITKMFFPSGRTLRKMKEIKGN